jgi:hypothetical protein
MKVHLRSGRGSRLIASIVLSLGAVIGVGVPFSGAASAVTALATQPSWPSWLARLARPTPASCQAGETSLAPTSAVPDSLGVIHFAYSDFPALTSSAPPRGFAAESASASLISDLEASGLAGSVLAKLPANPVAPSFCVSSSVLNGSAWEAAAAPAKGVEPLSKAQSSPESSPGNGDNTHYDTSNWAGYEVIGTVSQAQGQWTVETSAANQPTPNREDTWVGIGGGPTDSSSYGLIQAGTEMLTGSGYRSWFEYVCGACGKSIGVTFNSAYGVTFYSGSAGVRNGDQINTSVYWSTSTEPCFDLTDLTRSSGTFDGCVNNPGIPYDRTSGEWIDEGHYYSTGQYLANFGTTRWSQETLSGSPSGATASFTNYPYAGIVMADPGSSELPPCSNTQVQAYPENASSGTSDTVWCKST